MKTQTLRIQSLPLLLIGYALIYPVTVWAADTSWAVRQREFPRARRVLADFSRRVAKSHPYRRFLSGGASQKSRTDLPSKSRFGQQTADAPPVDPAVLAAQKAYGDYLKTQTELIHRAELSGRWAEARDRALRLLDADPANPYLATTLADADFRLGKYGEAYDALLPVSTSGQSQWVLLRLSVASARIGIIVPGQEQYVLSFLDNSWYGDGMLQEYRKYFAMKESPKEVAVLSHLACVPFEGHGAVNYQFHMREALALDPKNVVSNYIAAMMHQSGKGDSHYDYAVARIAVGGKMWQHLHRGGVRQVRLIK